MSEPTPPLNREHILALPAGRELDCLIMERIYGCERLDPGDVRFRPTPDMVERFRQQQPDVVDVGFVTAPYFSTQIQAAWALVEKLKHCDISIYCSAEMHFADGTVEPRQCEVHVAGVREVVAYHPAEAIAKAALLTTLPTA